MTFRDRLDRVWPSLVALLGTVAVVAGLLAVFGTDGEAGTGNDGAAAGTDTPAPGTSAGGSAPTPAAPVTAPPELRTEVGILNGTQVSGLAAQAQKELEAGGWTVSVTETYSGDVAVTTVYFPPDLEESAQALAAQFPEIKAVEPTIPGLTKSRLVLILADDYADTAGAGG